MAEDESGSSVLQDQDVEEIRNAVSEGGQIDIPKLNRIVAVTLERDRKVQADLKESETGDEVEDGRNEHRAIYGSETADDITARAFKRFDAAETKPQACEFFQYEDAEVKAYGFI